MLNVYCSVVCAKMESIARRITRAFLVSEPKSTKKSRSKKKVDCDDSPLKDQTSNMSLMSDEGNDLSYSFSTSLHLPSTIIKPQHPLPNSWTFWYSAGNKHLSWKQNQVKIASVATIEGFWLVYNQVKLASSLPSGHTYSVFRGNILPDWEDKANREGGRWMASWDKIERQEMLDTRWLEVLFMLIGEHMDKKVARLVTGAEVCVRKKLDRIEVWVGDVSDMARMLEVGRLVKKKMEVGSINKIQFSIHREEREGVVGPILML